MTYQPISNKDLGLEDLHDLHPKVFANLIEQARRANALCDVASNITTLQMMGIAKPRDFARLDAAVKAYRGAGK